MKPPESLTLVRHAESVYNTLNTAKQSGLYLEFKHSFSDHPLSAHTQALARKVKELLSLDYSDSDTPLTTDSGLKAAKMAERLSGLIPLPDVIFVSPYRRTKQTLDYMKTGWPDLNYVETIEDDRVREKEYGQFNEYNDWHLMYAFHPEQEIFFEQQGKHRYRPPGGENDEDVIKRTWLWYEDVKNRYSRKNVLVVTHDITILCVRAVLEDLSEKQFIKLYDKQRPANCGVTIYRSDLQHGHQKLTLEVYNADLLNQPI